MKDVMNALYEADQAFTDLRSELETTKQALASAVADVERFRAKAEKLEKALRHIADQWLPESMGPNIRKNADWEGTYEMMVQLARETLQP